NLRIETGLGGLILNEALEPLFILRDMTHLKLICCLEDLSQLKRMVTAWPCLHVLEHCPKLRKMTLRFRFNPLEGPGAAICNRNITTLDVGYSLVNDPAAT